MRLSVTTAVLDEGSRGAWRGFIVVAFAISAARFMSREGLLDAARRANVPFDVSSLLSAYE